MKCMLLAWACAGAQSLALAFRVAEELAAR